MLPSEAKKKKEFTYLVVESWISHLTFLSISLSIKCKQKNSSSFRQSLLQANYLTFYPYPCGSAGKESACKVGDLGSISGLGRSPGEGNYYPLQYPGLENSVDCSVHGVTKSQTQLRDFHFHFLILKPQFPQRQKGRPHMRLLSRSEIAHEESWWSVWIPNRAAVQS